MNTWINFGSKGFVWLLTWSWQALLLLGAVWAGLKLCRTQSPALRHHVWLAALIAVALLPALAVVAEKLPLPKTESSALNYVATIPQPVVALELLPQPIESAVPVHPARIDVLAPNRWPMVFAAMFGLWIAGAAISLARLWRQQLAIQRLRIAASLVSAAEFGCDESRVELALSDEIASPVLAGVWRPMILLPADIASWTNAGERRAMIEHELAHAARRDHLGNLFQHLIGASLFFHPLVRFACRQLQLERELACDDLVIHSGVKSDIYAESILKAAERSLLPTSFRASAPGGAHQLAFFSTRKTLERRIEMILSPDRIRVVARPWRYLALPVALIAIASFLLVPGRAGKTPTVLNHARQSVIETVNFVKADGQWRGANSFASMQKGKQPPPPPPPPPAPEKEPTTPTPPVPPTAKQGVTPPPPPPPPAPEKEPTAPTPPSPPTAKKGAMLPPPPPPPPPFLTQLPNKEYNFQTIGREGYNPIRWQKIETTTYGKQGAQIRLRNIDLRAEKVVFAEGAYYLIDRFEIQRQGQVFYGSGTLKIVATNQSTEYFLSSGGGIYLSSQRTGQPIDFGALLRQ